MDRQEIKSKIIERFLQEIEQQKTPGYNSQLQMTHLLDLFRDQVQPLPGNQHGEFFSIVYEIVYEFINNGLLYTGKPTETSQSFPWLTITSYGKEVFLSDKWLPYDPEGYISELIKAVPDIDAITLSYIGEAVSSFNRHQLLSATITLGVASENLMLLLIDSYLAWLSVDSARQSRVVKSMKDKSIYAQFKLFKAEFSQDIKGLPKELQADWETYLDGVFNFIRINRNSAGHPTGKKLNAKTIYANLQMFAEYARYVSDLIKALS